jgi:hypothetical protein
MPLCGCEVVFTFPLKMFEGALLKSLGWLERNDSLRGWPRCQDIGDLIQ